MLVLLALLGTVALGMISAPPERPLEQPYRNVTLQQDVLYVAARAWSASLLNWRRDVPLQWLQEEGGSIRLVRNASVLAKNVLLHDVTDVFGEGDDIHSHYLTGRGARATSIAEILR